MKLYALTCSDGVRRFYELRAGALGEIEAPERVGNKYIQRGRGEDDVQEIDLAEWH